MAFHRLEAVFLSLLLIHQNPTVQDEHVMYVHYQNIHESDIECLSDFSLAANSQRECASKCTQDEECLYFQWDKSVDGSLPCLLCSTCVHTAGVFTPPVFMMIDTSQIYTGRIINHQYQRYTQ